MRKILLFNLFLLFVLSACNQSKKSKEGDSVSGSAQKIIQNLPENFYKRLEGEIAGKAVVMHLQKVGGDYSGSYYYNGSWLNLSTDTLIGKDSIVLFENSFTEYYFNEKARQARLTLKWTGDGFKGDWESGDTKKKYAVSLQEQYPEGSYPFTAGMYEDSVKAFVGDPKSPAAKISFEYVQNQNKDESAAWLDNQLKRISGIRRGTVDRSIGFKNIAEAYFADYKQSAEEQRKSSRDNEFRNWLNYTNNSQQSIDYNDKGYVVIDFLADAYTGGAHGNYSSTMYCFDVKQKKQLGLSDVVKIDSNSLQTILEKNFRKQYNVKASEPISKVLFDDFIKPNNNFYFNSNGLAFMYNPYEVASYAQGQIVVFIPFDDLKGYLNPAFATRMGL